MILGLRPHAFVWPAPDGSPRLDIGVAAVEFLGNATLVFFEPPCKPIGGGTLSEPATGLWTARLEGNAPVNVGDRMTFP